MRALRKLRLRIASLLLRRKVERELACEIQTHIEQLVRQYVTEGMSEKEALLQARREFGGIEVFKDECRDARRVASIEGFTKDLRLAVRSLNRSPAFSVTAILTLALGIGVNVALFNVIYAILLSPLPYREADRLVHIAETHPDFPSYQVAVPDFMDWKQSVKSFEGLAAYTFRLANDLTLTDKGEPEAIQGVQASANLFPLLGVQPLRGKLYSAEEEKSKAAVILLSESLWRQRYGSDPEIIGKKIRVIDSLVTVVGVIPQQQAEPSWAQVWIPMSNLDPALTETRRFHVLEVIGRLRPGVDVNHAQVELNNIASGLARTYPQTNSKVGASIQPISSWLTGKVRPAMLIAFAAVLLVLLLACINVAHLVLVRTLQRRREIAMRAALGADLARIYRFLMVENLTLAIAGGSAGLALAQAVLPLLLRLVPFEITFLNLPGFSPASLLSAAAVILFCVILFAFPALLYSRNLDLQLLIKNPRASLLQRRSPVGPFVVMCEIALALTMVSAAGLLYKSFALLLNEKTGFDSQNVLAVEMPLALDWHGSATIFEQKIGSRLRGIPGIRSVAAVNTGPMMLRSSETSRFTRPFAVVGAAASPIENAPIAQVRWITPDYFRSLGIPLKQGRLFTAADIGQPAYIVNETLARKFFGQQNPIGQRLWKGVGDKNSTVIPIIGVVADVRDLGLDIAPAPTLYELGVTNWMTILVRSDVPSAAIAGAVRAAIRSVSPDDAISRLAPLDELVQSSIDKSRSELRLIGMFAVLAAALAAVGVFGVVTYALSQRTNEFAVRFAIGAKPRDIWMLTIRNFAYPVAAGLFIGGWLSYLFGYALRTELYKVAPLDPLVLFISCLSVVLAMILTATIPISNALSVSPAAVLRES